MNTEDMSVIHSPECALPGRFAALPERFAVWPQKAKKWHLARLLGVLHKPWQKVHTILYLRHRAAGRLPKQSLCQKVCRDWLSDSIGEIWVAKELSLVP